jgi:Spy/CpxP family protein refolding chaperone
MQKTFTRIAVGLGAVALVAGLGSHASIAAQDQNTPAGQGPFMGRGGRGGPGGPGGMPGRGPGGPLGLPPMALGQLGLTEAQRDQIRSTTQSHQEAMRPLAERAMNARRAVEDAVTADTYDEGAIRSRSAELAAAETELAVARARVHADVLLILTPEQRAELKQGQAQREERARRVQERRQNRPAR